METLAEDLEATERVTRAAVERSAEIADNRALVLALIDLARASYERGDPIECLRILDESERYSAPPDWEIVTNRPATRALALAQVGQLAEAENLARQAVGHVEGTQFLDYKANALHVLGEVLRRSGRTAEAVNALEEGSRLFNSKGNIVMAARNQALIDELAAQCS